MKKAKYYLSAMLVVACFTQPVSAQFEGKISYNTYEVSEEGSRDQQDSFTLFITPERILLQGEKKYDFMGSLKTEGVLARLDFQDFVFLTGDEQALKISKSDITSMMNMFDKGQSTSKVAEDADDISYERSGKTQTIQGYDCEEFIFRDQDNENEYMSIWMTKDIEVNWGMLAEPWSGGADEIISNFPMGLIFKDKYFPVKAEGFENGNLVSSLEATEITESSIARAMVNVPSGVKVLSFQDYLFQKMSEQ